MPELPPKQKTMYVCSYFAGTAALFLGIGAISEKNKFTPIYKDIYWLPGDPIVKSIRPGNIGGVINPVTAVSGIVGSIFGSQSTATTRPPKIDGESSNLPNVEIDIPMRLWNPNPYHMDVQPKGAGSGYLGSLASEVAKAKPEPVTIPEGPGGDGYSVTEFKVHVLTQFGSDDLSPALVAALLTNPTGIDMLYEYEATVTVQPSIFWIRLNLTMNLAPKCKQTIDFIAQKVSPSVCGKSWDEIGVDGRRLSDNTTWYGAPPAGAAARRLTETPPANAKKPKVKQEQVDQAQGLVDTSLGGLGAVCIIAFIVLYIAPPVHYLVWKWRMAKAEAEKASGDAEAGAEDESWPPQWNRPPGDAKSSDQLAHASAKPQRAPTATNLRSQVSCVDGEVSPRDREPGQASNVDGQAFANILASVNGQASNVNGQASNVNGQASNINVQASANIYPQASAASAMPHGQASNINAQASANVHPQASALSAMPQPSQASAKSARGPGSSGPAKKASKKPSQAGGASQGSRRRSQQTE